MEERHTPPETAAQAWAEWAEDFGESPSNPPLGSWRALRDSFLGGMFMAVQMIGEHRGAYEYVHALDQELRTIPSGGDNEAMPMDEWMKTGTDDELQVFSDWLRKRSEDGDGMYEVWNLLDRDDDGDGRSLPDLGFAPELSTAIATLKAIANRDAVPRPENTDGLPRYNLATDMGTLAAATLWHIKHMANARIDTEGDDDPNGA